uniref:Aspartate/glutamate/uridylate kinase domain-containing protein n=1 Tax=Peronospora matthiolae TaxID=2874970 RepID=A0AAV1TJ10_9STRA
MTTRPLERRELGRDLRRARTILIKIGTEIVHSPQGLLALGHIGNIIEQIATLHMRGHEIILVSSGSVSIGKMVLHRQYLLSGSMQSHLGGHVVDNANFDEKACAAAGQSGLQSLYEMLFGQYHLACSQVLASDADFKEPQVRANLQRTVRALLDVGIIPVINENDVITRRTTPLMDENKIAWDNDSLAALFAQELMVDLMIVITDVDGIFTGTEVARQLLSRFRRGDKQVIATESRVGAVGQIDKLHSCIRAVDSGAVQAAVIAKAEEGALLRIVDGQQVGTLFVAEGERIGDVDVEEQHADPVYSCIASHNRSLISKL